MYWRKTNTGQQQYLMASVWSLFIPRVLTRMERTVWVARHKDVSFPALLRPQSMHDTWYRA